MYAKLSWNYKGFANHQPVRQCFMESSSKNDLILALWKDNVLFGRLYLVTLWQLGLINFIQNIARMFNFFYRLLLTLYEIGNELSIFGIKFIRFLALKRYQIPNDNIIFHKCISISDRKNILKPTTLSLLFVLFFKVSFLTALRTPVFIHDIYCLPVLNLHTGTLSLIILDILLANFILAISTLLYLNSLSQSSFSSSVFTFVQFTL